MRARRRLAIFRKWPGSPCRVSLPPQRAAPSRLRWFALPPLAGRIYRKCLGRSDARRALCPPPDFILRSLVPMFARGGSNVGALAPCHNGGSRSPDDSHGACGFAGIHQASQRGWRGPFRRQLFPPVREPDAAHHDQALGKSSALAVSDITGPRAPLSFGTS
jgi:hypothetical protein